MQLNSTWVFFLLIGTFMLFIYTIYLQIIAKTYKNIVLHGIILIVVICFSIFDFGERIFLGKHVAELTIAEAPGYTSINLYSKNICVLTYGGPFSTTEFYGDYMAKDSKIYVKINADLLELNNREISFNNTIYTIQQISSK